MALVSPGIQISINDQSQYVNSNVGSVPLVLLATAQDKIYNGSAATGTSKSNAGKLLSFTSQRDLVTAMGTPTFQLSAAGTPINADERNEYGLLTAYSALGLGNQLYAIRADIDLAQLTGTSNRPTGTVADGTIWLDTAATEWGIYSLDATESTFGHITPIIITDPDSITRQTYSTTTNVAFPLTTIGKPGDYALVAVNTTAYPLTATRLFYKAGSTSVSGLANTWVLVGSPEWQQSNATVIGTTASPSLTAGTNTLTVNGQTVTFTAGTVTTMVAAINNANITGVKAVVTSAGEVAFFVTSSATNGAVVLVDGTNTPLSKCGITEDTYHCPYLFFGNFAQQPTDGWFSGDPVPRPSGSIWWKTTPTGTGFNPVIKKYNAAMDTWESLSVSAYTYFSDAIYALDPVGGGLNIPHGTVEAFYSVIDTTYNTLSFSMQVPHSNASSITSATGDTPGGSITGTITINSSAPGKSVLNTTVIALTGTTATTFVTDILSANIPYVTAQLEADGKITLNHIAGGQINISNTSGTPLTSAGFVVTSGTKPWRRDGYTVSPLTGTVNISNWYKIDDTINFQSATPSSTPTDGTLWYYSNPAEVDIMINNGSGWRGYLNGGTDIRGYTLGSTDPAGVIVSATQPTSQSDATDLVSGDLWLDSGDLVNYPSLYRYNGSTWVSIDNTDHVSSNGIIFADARWATNGTTDPISDTLPTVAGLLSSNYIDQDAPDYRLYPKGTLLFNTRRSGYNVKKFVSNYFNSTSFPNLPTVPGASSSLPSIKDAWVSESGLDEYGALKAGSYAQRDVIVSALKSAVDSNLDVKEETYRFNLLVAPGYPELIPNLVTLNENRSGTGFIIGDTPMTLVPTSSELSAWSTNSGTWAGKGLATASPYLGVYYPSGLGNDLAGNAVAVPASHAVLRTFLYNDNVSYQWFAPAGVHRGLINNLSDIGYVNSSTGSFVHNGINQGLRDMLYDLQINPITQLLGTGLVVWGQETRAGTSSSRNRINVVRLENYLRTIFNSISNGFLFEPNDSITRKTLASQIESALHDVLSKRGIYDFLVICDTSNNTPSVIANNQLYVDVAIEPMKDVEFIYIPIALYNPGTIANLGATST